MRAAVALTALTACTSDIKFGDSDPTDGSIPDPPDEFDRDRDGYSVEAGDCDDNNELVGPGSNAFPEYCDGLDNDCGGHVDVQDVSGLSVCAIRDDFEQTLQVDVLFVVDTTGDMWTNYLPSLATGAHDILKALVGEDYLDSHIGVVTMDLEFGAGRLVTFEGERFISGTQIGEQASAKYSFGWAEHFLTDTIAANETSLNEPWGRGAVSLALSPDLADGVSPPNAGFIRSSAHLVIVFLSNDEDHTTDPTIDALEAELALLKGSLSEITMHAIVQDGEFDCYGDSKPDQKGYTYEKLAQDTAGTVLSICQTTSYAGFFEAMGQNSAYEGLETEFPLSEQAQPDSVEVTVVDGLGNLRPLHDFALADGNRTLVITADPPPSAGAIIRVDYKQVP